MRINNIDNSRSNSFKGAKAFIFALSDVHSQVGRLPGVLKNVNNFAGELSNELAKPSTATFFAIAGDFGVNQSKKGYLTHKELTNGDFQHLALLKFIDILKCTVKNINVLFVPGNHDLDGGDERLFNLLRKTPMSTLVTNVNLEKSPTVTKAIESSNKFAKSFEYTIPDDKKPELFHKILFVGATIPSMDFYNPGICKGLEFYDNSSQKDSNLTESKIQETINSIKEEVEKFKSNNPQGVVVLMSHMGERLSNIILKNVPEINHILNGHDHKNTQTNLEKTSINSLGKDGEMLKTVEIDIDDDGNLSKITTTPYFTSTVLSDGLEKHPFQLFLNEYLRDDMAPLIEIEEIKTYEAPKPQDYDKEAIFKQSLERMGINEPKVIAQLSKVDDFKQILVQNYIDGVENENKVAGGITELPYGNEIRYQNSYLMNYLTSAIKRQIRDRYVPDIFSVAIQSSVIRNGLKDGGNNLELMNVFSGVSEDLSGIKIGTIKGHELAGMITENILDNLVDNTRNTIIHWSDVQINRTLIDKIKNKKYDGTYLDAIRVRNPITKEFEPIDSDFDYKIAIMDKYLLKESLKWPPLIKDRFTSLGKTYDDIFREYLNGIDYKIKITPKTKEKRIL
ncbi:MAG: metallophosphoesterase [bacterium]|nr:metallophosphoesterase [bacterium]